MRVLVQDLYGHDSVFIMPNPLAKTWESNSGSQYMYATGLPTQRRSSVVLCTHSVPQQQLTEREKAELEQKLDEKVKRTLFEIASDRP